MGTRSYICVEQDDGTYKGVYCHWDGYLSHNGALLVYRYNSMEMAELIMELGNLSSLGSKLFPDPIDKHNFDVPQEDVTVAYGRDRGETDTEAATVNLQDLNEDYSIEFCYVFTKDNIWRYFKHGRLKDGLKDVEADLLEEDRLKYNAQENKTDKLEVNPPEDFNISFNDILNGIQH